MTSSPQVFFGTDAQRALLQRGADLHVVTQNDIANTYYGRTVGIADGADASVDRLAAMARMQGSASCADMTAAELEPIQTGLTNAGFAPHVFARWEGAETVLQAAQQIAQDRTLPAGLTLTWLSPDSPDDLRTSFAQAALSCDVLPPNLATICGGAHPGVCALAVNTQGEVASCAGASALLHRDHPRGRDLCWWGMLATPTKYRGHGLALLLGAQTIIAMHDTYGFTDFFTGVTPGNTASEAICRKMGLADTGRFILMAADTSLLPGGRMTK